ncbi:MAG: sigma-54 dependent transcriptional regulator [Ignavibacteriales bacterium]|nr:sigma-54 dependent transcriptional regulator [Ignavibacteriales bacterium]
MKILLVDDDRSIRKGIETFLISENHVVSCYENGKDALEKCKQEKFDLIVSDMMMPEMTGLDFLINLKNESDETPFILITAYASIEDAVTAMKIGAEDYLTKPLNLLELKLKIDKIKSKRILVEENIELKEKLKKMEFPDLIGNSKTMIDVKNKIIKIAADPDVSVMIYGESGTGKEIVARNIHYKSKRVDKPFMAINCAALSDEILESELFGHVKGSFTNAIKDKIGLFQAADKGTLFLDEVSQMSPRLQAKLLRVLQERNFQQVGSTQTISVDVRIIGASNKDLKKLIEEEKFREDLYYRLNVIEICLPTLSERSDDIPLLINHFLQKENIRMQKQIFFSPESVELLQKYSWKGNVRELENFIRMMFVTTEKQTIEPTDLPESIFSEVLISSLKWKNLWRQNNFQTALNSAIENFEREFLTYHIKNNCGNISKTAEAIGLSRVSLHKKISQYKLISDEKNGANF